MPGFNTQAVLLRKIEYGDHDYIISFLTRTRGKISVIAKNAKQSVKRFSGALDLFSLNQIQCTFPKKNRDALIILSHAELENGFGSIREDVFKTAYAGYWSELVHSWLEEEKPSPEIYGLLKKSLFMLDAGVVDKAVLNLLFQIHFISLSGFSPNIENCDGCGTPIDHIPQDRIWFDFREGRILCRNCLGKEKRYGMNISKGTLKQLFWINNNDVERADRIRFSGFALKEGRMLLEAFLPFHLGRDFNSLKFLKQLRGEA